MNKYYVFDERDFMPQVIKEKMSMNYRFPKLV